MSLRVLLAAPECFPYVKVGGLGDVLGALPQALRGLGVDARVLLPGLDAVLNGLGPGTCLRTWPDLLGGGEARLLRAQDGAGLTFYLLDQPAFFRGLTGPYEDGPDLPRRFAALAWAAAAVAREGDGGGWHPDALHAHDWTVGLAPAYLAFAPGPRVPSLMTIHNLAFQGRFDPALRAELWLPPEAYALEGAEFHGTLSFLKAGLHYATRLSTVSPTYAREIQAPGGGFGLEGLLAWRGHDLTGILNGVDRALWNPATDPHLATRYEASSLPSRATNKTALQAELGLAPEPGATLLGVVSRLDPHKGLDLLLACLDGWVASGGQLALLGSGDSGLEAGFRDAAARHPGRVGMGQGYNEGLAHRIFAGADLVAVPSRMEPCGLTQLYALRYGAVPVVRRTGGLADTVVDATPEALDAGTATGFGFDAPEPWALEQALCRAQALFADVESWAALQRTGMAQDFGWEASAKQYAALYRKLIS